MAESTMVTAAAGMAAFRPDEHLAVSMRWLTGRMLPPARAVATIQAAGFTAVEVCGVVGAEAPLMARALAGSGVRAVSMHAPCPDSVVDGQRVPGDWFLDDDDSRRAAATRAAVETLAYARELDVNLVVLHLGAFGLAHMHHELCALVDRQDPRAGAARDEYRRARDDLAHRSSGRLFGLIDTLLAAAGDVTVCVENRYRHDQVPNVTDAMVLCERYPAGSGLAYWHDTGHEAAQRHLGLWSDHDFQEIADRIAGLHAHDCVGTDDHLIPGAGNYDFTAVRRWSDPGRPVVLEPDPRATQAELIAGRAFLARALAEEPQDRI